MMLRPYFTRLTILLLTIIASDTVIAQNPAKPIAKFKPPVVKSALGNNTSASNSISLEEGKSSIALPLKVVDEKNNFYAVSSYQFAYKRKGVVEDDSSGQVTAESDMVANRFTSTPLPDIWIKTIKAELHTGEQLYFFDIIAKDDKGHLFFAPELKLTVQ